MKKLFALLVVLALCGAANAVMISLTDEGTAVSASAGVEYTLEVSTNGLLLGADMMITVTGDATISGAMSLADCATYGWDPTLSADPVAVAGGIAIGGCNFSLNAGPQIGYVKVIYGSGEVVISISPSSLTVGGSMDENMGPVDFSSGVVTLLPEPMTIALLGLGGLFIRRRK